LRALHRSKAPPSGDVRVWLLAIVRRCCATWKSARHADPGPPQIRDTEAPAMRSSREAIHVALKLLSRELREVIVLREVHQMSYREIGEVIGAPVSTVMLRLARARRPMGAALGRSSEAAV
jgi:RNA polymerase sigma-70 factor (ECF subfamily)